MPDAPITLDDYLPAEAFGFPDGFLWGTSNAAHQVEGGNWANDWWAWEQNPDSPCVEPSGDACDYWNRYPEDLDLCAAGGGQNVHRFSLEWSRIQPDANVWSSVAVDHYKRLADAVAERGMTPMITLHHFSTPRWCTTNGTWADDAIVDRYRAFTERICAELGPDRLQWVCTVNEPSIVATLGYFLGMFPPGVRDPDAQAKASANLLRAHAAGVAAVKAVAPQAQVGLCLALSDIHPANPDDANAVALATFTKQRMTDVFVDALRTGEVRWLAPSVEEFALDAPAGLGDFVGCQYYQRMAMDPTQPTMMAAEPDGTEMTQMGVGVWPEGFRLCLNIAASTGLPVIVTENGMSTADDRRRCAWIAAHLHQAHLARSEDGVDLRGYVYWSTTDNFEWALGYGPKFGLIGIDRDNDLARVPRPSLELFGEIARTNSVDPAVVARYVGA